jgi:uncharacterized delta-60 repeat protein
MAVMRLDLDGRPDEGFGDAGVAVADAGMVDASAFAVAIQKDGKIVAVGPAGNNFGVARWRTDGIPDPEFNRGKIAALDFGHDDIANAVAIQKDGKIVAGGITEAGGDVMCFALGRFNTDGRPDHSFGTHGRVITDLRGVDFLASLGIQSDGKIVAAGTTSSPGVTRTVLARYQKNGRLDRGFGALGKLIVDDGGSALAIQKDDKIVSAGLGMKGGQLVIDLVRYQKDGRPDHSFGMQGKVLSDVVVAFTEDVALAIQKDGGIVVVGAEASSATESFLLTRFRSSGQLDTSFGNQGVVTTGFGRRDVATAVAVAPDGRIIAVGRTDRLGGQVAVARYLGNQSGVPAGRSRQ